MKIGKFLPSAVLVGVAMMFSGLGHWVEAGWVQEMVYQEKDGSVHQINHGERIQMKWRTRRRPVLPPVFTVVSTHTIGLLSFQLICSPIFFENQFVRNSSNSSNASDRILIVARSHHSPFLGCSQPCQPFL